MVMSLHLVGAFFWCCKVAQKGFDVEYKKQEKRLNICVESRDS